MSRCNVLKGADLQKHTIDAMNKSNMKIYGAQWCGHCTSQKSTFNHVGLEENGIFIDCANSNNSNKCKNITAFPTWISGKKVVAMGHRPVEELCILAEKNIK